MKIPLNILFLLFALFLLRFPPLYFFGIQNTFLTTHVISVAIFISLFLGIINKAHKEKNQTFYYNTEIVLILIFFITQSLSIIGAQNILVFLQRYSKILIGFLLYLLAKTYITHYKNRVGFFDLLIKIILFGSMFALFFQLLLFIFPDIYFKAGEYIIYKNVLDITNANFKVGKLFDDSYLELIIPILIYYLLKEKNLYRKFLFFYIIFVIGLLTVVSNFRYRLLTFIFSFCLTFFLLKIREKHSLNKVFGLLILIFLILTILNPFIQQLVKHTAIDRLIDKEEFEDSSSISWRLKMFSKSIELTQTNFFGVGLGNMFDYLPKKELNGITKNTQISLGALSSGPHNIFFQFLSDTGFMGLFVFILLLSFYVKKDFSIIKENREKEKVTFIAMFWTLIFISQFFPSVNLTFYTLFFILRGTI